VRIERQIIRGLDKYCLLYMFPLSFCISGLFTFVLNLKKYFHFSFWRFSCFLVFIQTWERVKLHLVIAYASSYVCPTSIAFPKKRVGRKTIAFSIIIAVTIFLIDPPQGPQHGYFKGLALQESSLFSLFIYIIDESCI
jgi:hypothetical protein